MELPMKNYVVVLAVIGSTASAYAQPAGAQAEVLFREGRDLMAAGKYGEACAAFQKSQQLDPAITTLLNLAGCREKNGELATAWGLFLDAERKTRTATDATTVKFHAVAKQRAAALEPRISKLTISVPQKSTAEGLEIMRGSERVDSVMWNRALPIDGGTYTITARAPGANAWSTQVTIGAERDTKTVDIPDLRNLPADLSSTVAAKANAVTSKPEEQELQVDPGDQVDEGSSGASGKSLSVIVGASGVALLGAAVGVELWGRSTYNDAKAETMVQARRDSLYDSANTKRYAAQGLAVAGVGCVGIAVWLYLRGGDQEPAESVSRRQLVVSPTGIAIAGSF